MTRPLLLLALALGFLLWLRGRDAGVDRAPARWLEDDDGVLAPDPRTVGLLEVNQRLRDHVATRRWPSAFCPGCKAAEAAGIR